MGILDEAIREHLELKRQHGADDSELKQLEDEAFGPPERPGSGDEAPDALDEAPTQFMAQPDDGGDEAPKSEQRREAAAGILDLQEEPGPIQQDEPSEEAQPAGEHEAVSEPEVAAEAEAPAEAEAESAQESSEDSAGHSTEERHAIAEHPTELYDVEEEFSVSAPGAEEPATEAAADEEEDDFFSEQRLSEELDQALDAPRDSEPEALETEAEFEPEEAAEPEAAEPEAHEPADDEPDFDEEDGELEDEDEQPDYEEQQTELVEEPRSEAGSEGDVLEGTPDFLEQTPEDDELWFEQKPPKDFDFDD